MAIMSLLPLLTSGAVAEQHGASIPHLERVHKKRATVGQLGPEVRLGRGTVNDLARDVRAGVWVAVFLGAVADSMRDAGRNWRHCLYNTTKFPY